MRAVVVAAALLVSACGSSANSGTVTRAEFERAGDIWPLTVDQAVIGCDGINKWVEVAGVRYGINGYARQAGLPGMEPVWRVDEEAERMLRAAGDKNPFKPRVSDFAFNQAAGKFCNASG